MEAAAASRRKLKQLLEAAYEKCNVYHCEEQREEELIVLPCIHAICKTCVAHAVQQAIEASKSPARLRPTKYLDPRRFECPVCRWPQYRPYETDGFTAYPSKLPLHADLLAVGDNPPAMLPSVSVTDKTKKTDPHGYETMQGNYVFESTIGEYGDDIHHGQMKRIVGLAVDEYYQTPLVVISESTSKYILSFHLHGRLEQARETKLNIRDLCIGPVGTVIVSVAEEDYALAKWDSALFSPSGGCRHENIFRNIYGHSSQINSEPFGVAQDSQGRFMVTMLAKDRVCRWDERKVGDNIAWYGDSGRGRIHFNGPYYVAKMSNDLTVLSCMHDHKVKIINDEREQLVTEIGGLGCDVDFLCYPHGVCVDSDDNIYIADTGNFRVVKYNHMGEFLCCVVKETWNYGHDVKPTNVAVMRDGRLLVAMQGHGYCKVHVYLPKKERNEDDCDCSCSKCFIRSCCWSHGDYEALC